MRVHVFGNSPLPAVAIFGLRRVAQSHFHVDDGLISLPTEAEAIDLLKRTQAWQNQL